MSKPLAKSLHTITVLYRIALDQFEHDNSQEAESCVAAALNILGYDNAAGHVRSGPTQYDQYGLAAKAVDMLKATYPHHFGVA